MKQMILLFLLSLQLKGLSQRDPLILKNRKLNIPNELASGNIGFSAFHSNYNDKREFESLQSITAVFSKEIYDSSGNYKDSVFTVPIDGFYHFDALVIVETIGYSGQFADFKASISIASKKNESIKECASFSGNPRNVKLDVYRTEIQMFCNLYLNRGDKVRVRITGDGFAGKAVYNGGTFSGYKIF
ncbi:MAG: DUF2092 domain-containing protein [Chitinophagaceae bacterium]|nr:DUF2092 domain-containing protein [Chitinophagaceae bacterium]